MMASTEADNASTTFASLAANPSSARYGHAEGVGMIGYFAGLAVGGAKSEADLSSANAS